MEIYKNLSLDDLENEIWRDVVGYEGLYKVSNFGRVKSLKDNNGKYREKILKFAKNNKGYLYVCLCKEGKVNKCKAHRIVAQAFLENPNNLPMINHKDECKTNNVVTNIEWCTAKFNCNYGTRNKRIVANTDYKEKVANTDYKAIAEKQSKQVFQYSKDLELISVWKSTRECDRNGFDSGHVSACCRGKLQHYKGYIWSYEPIK